MNSEKTLTSELIYLDIQCILAGKSSSVFKTDADRDLLNQMLQLEWEILQLVAFLERGQWPVKPEDVLNINRLDRLLFIAEDEYGIAGETIGVDLRNILEKMEGYSIFSSEKQSPAVQDLFTAMMYGAWNVKKAAGLNID